MGVMIDGGKVYQTDDPRKINGFMMSYNDQYYAVPLTEKHRGLEGYGNGAFQSDTWASDGRFSMWIPEGFTVSLGEVTRRTFIIDARRDGQLYWVEYKQHTAKAGPNRIRGTGQVTLGPGYWDSFDDYSGGYEGDHIPWGPRVEPVLMSVQRRWNDGPWKTIIEGLNPKTAWTDPLPPTNGTVCYRAISWSNLGTAALGSYTCQLFVDATNSKCEGREEATDSLQHAWVNAGVNFRDSAVAYFDLKVPADSIGLAEVETHYFAGRKYPVEYRGVSLVERIAVSARVGPDQFEGLQLSTVDEWIAIVEQNTDHYYRDYLGRYFPCSLTPIAVEPLGRGFFEVQFEVTRVDGERLV